VGIVAYGSLLYGQGWQALLHSDACRLAGYGFTAGCFVWFLLARPLQFYQVFIHELTHLAAGLLFFKKPRRLVASAGGGRVELYGGNFVVTLAPYCFPLLAGVLVVLVPLIDRAYHGFFHGAIGFFAGAHVITVVQQFRLHQPDIREAGALFSVLFCLCANIVAAVAVIGFLQGGYRGAWSQVMCGALDGQALVASWGGRLYAYVERILL
jgi:hypothetical protein